jgi:predicted ribosome quality control (RQC) complex YloA/Tae2 family protein
MNDELTFTTARRTDYWLHAQKIHGSHVIIRCEGGEPPERTIMEAAGLAVYYSQARTGGRAPVDYTMVRCVKKPSGAMPGFVIYNDYRTIIAEGGEDLAERLKNR